ncbi:MAG: domain S-box-containing protein [Mucilaginibacter sp.]|nr:domain S-box-containing protein [Mucilaginibacter sp.]
MYKLIGLHDKRLLENEKQYRSYFEDNPDPMWTYNRYTLAFTAVNNAAVAHYGYSREEFLHMRILDIRPAEEAEKLYAAVKSLQETYNNSGIWTHRKKDGTLFSVQISSHQVTSGREGMVMVRAKDITELKQLEEERNEYLLKLEDMLNSMSDAFFSLDRAWNIRSANAMYEKISGFKKEDIIGQNLLELWPQPMDSVFYENFKKVLEEQAEVRFDVYSPVLRKWLRMVGYPTKDGAAVYFTDITESKQKDIQLQQALERYELAARATQNMLYEFDMAHNKISYSQSYGHFANIDMAKEEDPSAAWLSLVHPDDLLKLTDAMGQTLKKGNNKYECEYRVDCGNKNYRYVYDQANIIYNDERKPLRMIGAIKDINDLKENEASLLQQNNILREIAWAGSHEVRRPLASILGLIDLVRASDSEEEKQDYFKFIDLSAHELDEMVCKINDRIKEVI